MHHPRYCLTHHPGISSNITNATHFSTSATPTMLAHRPLYPCWCTTLAIHADTSPQHAVYITHASTSTTLARHPRQHTTNANNHPCQHPSHASTPPIALTITQIARHFSNSWVSNYAFKAFSSEIPRGNLALFKFNFYFYNLYFLGLFKHFHRSLENCHRKIKLFQRKLVCLIQKTTIFSKTNAQHVS